MRLPPISQWRPQAVIACGATVIFLSVVIGIWHFLATRILSPSERIFLNDVTRKFSAGTAQDAEIEKAVRLLLRTRASASDVWGVFPYPQQDSGSSYTDVQTADGQQFVSEVLFYPLREDRFLAIGLDGSHRVCFAAGPFGGSGIIATSDILNALSETVRKRLGSGSSRLRWSSPPDDAIRAATALTFARMFSCRTQQDSKNTWPDASRVLSWVRGDGLRRFPNSRPLAEAAFELCAEYPLGLALHVQAENAARPGSRPSSPPPNLDPRVVARLASVFGPLDWRTTIAHCLYWSFSQSEMAAFQRSPRVPDDPGCTHWSTAACLPLYGRVNACSPEPEDLIFFAPELRSIAPTLRYLQDPQRLREGWSPDARDDALKHFLSTAVTATYLCGYRDEADRLAAARNAVSQFKMSAEMQAPGALPREASEYTRGLVDKRLRRSIASASVALCVGDGDGARYHEASASLLWESFVEFSIATLHGAPNRPAPAYPTFAQIETEALRKFLSGDPMFPRALVPKLRELLHAPEDATQFQPRLPIAPPIPPDSPLPK